MENYPLTIMDFEKSFATEEACRDYLIQLRWPNDFVCPHCQTRNHWYASRNRLICRHCRHHTYITAGTIFHDTHKPLGMWFRAAWHVTSRKHGASA